MLGEFSAEYWDAVCSGLSPVAVALDVSSHYFERGRYLLKRTAANPRKLTGAQANLIGLILLTYWMKRKEKGNFSESTECLPFEKGESL